MSEVVILRGLPASGKTLEAAKLVMRGYKRINSTELKLSIEGDPSFTSKSKCLKSAINSLFKHYMFNGYNVVFDDVNLDPYEVRQILRIAHDYKAKIQILDIDTPLEVCLQRDLDRVSGRVGRDIILDLHDRWIKPTGGFPKL